jgi:energy-coupling factor transporter ATP-binding protein EcfA2
MTNLSGIVALDGHDGAGKTTLARALAERVHGLYVKPFHGVTGAALLDAGAAGDLDALIAVGTQAIHAAVESTGGRRPLILDRGWMTVASLCPRDGFELFATRWSLWMPTALCWADLPTTLMRLAVRDESPESVASHQHYLHVYRCLAERTDGLILRTDEQSTERCLEILVKWMQRIDHHDS